MDDANGDPDQDGLTNALEFINGTDPEKWDSDGDLLPDGWEIQHGLIAAFSIEINDTWVYGNSGANGRAGDPDGDGIENQYEYVLAFNPKNANTNGTADNAKDRDGDGMKDWREAATGEFRWDDQQEKSVFTKGLDWEVNDAAGDLDQDGLTNAQELINGTDPKKWDDSDGDLLPDGWEIQHGLNPLDSSGANGATGDPDGDGLSNLDELMHGTKPKTSDSDGDGATDKQETEQGSNPNDNSDQGQAPPAEKILEVPFSIGDPSGSHSERWKLTIQGDGPDDNRKIEFVSPDFGEMGTKTFKLRKLNKYTITVAHVATNSEDGKPDYDWEAQIDGNPSSESTPETSGQAGSNNFFMVKDHWLVDNREAVLTAEKHGNDNNIVAGKRAILLPVEVVVHKKDEAPPEDGVLVKKGDTVVYEIPGLPESVFVYFERRYLDGNGQYGHWWSFSSGANAGKSRIEEEELTTSIFQVRARIVASGPGIYVNYTRKRDDPHGKSSSGVMNPMLKAGEPDFVGVAEGDAQIAIVKKARESLGSTAWSLASTVTVSPTATAGPNDNKCNVFVYQSCMNAGASVPLDSGGWPPRAYDWFDSSFTITGWNFRTSYCHPAPGQVVSRYLLDWIPIVDRIPGTSAHVGIVDYNGSWINAGPANINRYPHISNSDYQTAHYRQN